MLKDGVTALAEWTAMSLDVHMLKASAILRSVITSTKMWIACAGIVQLLIFAMMLVVTRPQYTTTTTEPCNDSHYYPLLVSCPM